MQATRFTRALALVGFLAFVLALVPSHSEAGTIPTPSGTGAVCVVNGKVQPTACSISAGITSLALGGTGADLSACNANEIPAITNAGTAMSCRNHINFGSDAATATTGRIRLPDANAPVIVGLNAASDYAGLTYGASANSTWTLGNGAEYTQINGFDVRAAPAGGGSLFLGALGTWTDSSSAIVSDLATLTWDLTSNFTTTVVTATPTAFTWPVVDAERWDLECNLTTQCSSTGGSKYSISAPATSTIEGWIMASTSAITTLSYQRITAISTLNATATHTVATTPGPDKIHARIVVVGSGSITLNAASVTNGQTTTIFAGSFCRARRSYAK